MWPLKSSRQVSLARESVLLDLNVDCVIHGEQVDQPFREFDASQLSKVGLPPGLDAKMVFLLAASPHFKFPAVEPTQPDPSF